MSSNKRNLRDHWFPILLSIFAAGFASAWFIWEEILTRQPDVPQFEELNECKKENNDLKKKIEELEEQIRNGKDYKKSELEHINTLIFKDNFDSEPKKEWSPSNGNWTMVNGMYSVENVEEDIEYNTFIKEKSWSEFSLKVDIKPGNVSYDKYYAIIYLRRSGNGDCVCFGIGGKEGSFDEIGWFLYRNGKPGEPFGRVNIKTSKDETVNIKIRVKGNVYTAYLNNSQIGQISDSSFSSGSVGLGCGYEDWRDPKVRVAFDNLEILPLK